MQMELASSGAHLTYCTNIHPGESWDEVRANLQRHVLKVKRACAPNTDFGVGLRLSAQAAQSLREPDACEELCSFLHANDLYVFTINGFPYGEFHQTRVKEQVYRPDWRDPRRLAYSNCLADVLAKLLPQGELQGSVSTVPGGFKPEIQGKDDINAIVGHLLDHAAHLHRIRESTGRVISLALEPEPYCFIETIEETCRFFDHHLFSDTAVKRFANTTGLSSPEAVLALRRHLGVCLDACHAAVEFEDAKGCIESLRRHEIGIKKLQLSAGLRIPNPEAIPVAAFERLVDDVYLHQVVERTDTGALRRFVDLPQALESLRAGCSTGGEWRIHFHVPIFLAELEPFESTQTFLRELLTLHASVGLSQHLEVETYTWDVLPAAWRQTDVDEAIARELSWAKNCLGEP
jgi:hypothetical protein